VLPYYNTWGDERIAVQHCFFFWCSTGPDTSYGDVVLQPDTDVPTQDTAGAARGSSRPDTPAKAGSGTLRMTPRNRVSSSAAMCPL